MRLIDADKLPLDIEHEDIDDAPTIDAVEVKHGEWTYENHWWSSFPECSCCGEMQTIESNYCPNCGAKMKGEHE